MANSNEKMIDTMKELEAIVGKINGLLSKQAINRHDISTEELKMASNLIQFAKTLHKQIEASK